MIQKWITTLTSLLRSSVSSPDPKALVRQVEDGEEQNVIDQKLLAAEAEELREGLSTMVEKWPGGGETVKKEDLWDCLFSSGGGVLSNKKATNGVVSRVDRELRAHSAEMMAAKGGGINRRKTQYWVTSGKVEKRIELLR